MNIGKLEREYDRFRVVKNSHFERVLMTNAKKKWLVIRLAVVADIKRMLANC